MVHLNICTKIRKNASLFGTNLRRLLAPESIHDFETRDRCDVNHKSTSSLKLSNIRHLQPQPRRRCAFLEYNAQAVVDIKTCTRVRKNACSFRPTTPHRCCLKVYPISKLSVDMICLTNSIQPSSFQVSIVPHPSQTQRQRRCASLTNNVQTVVRLEVRTEVHPKMHLYSHRPHLTTSPNCGMDAHT